MLQIVDDQHFGGAQLFLERQRILAIEGAPRKWRMKSSARRNKVRLPRLRNSNAAAFNRWVLPKPKPPWM